MKRILFVLHNLGRGGAERVVLTTIKCLRDSQIEPSLFLVRKSGALLNEVPRDIHLAWGVPEGVPARFRPRTVCRLLQQEASRCDAVVAGLELAATYWTYAALRSSAIPMIGWVHTSFADYVRLGSASRVNFPVSHFVYRRFKHIVCPSSGAAESLTHRLKVAADVVRIIHNSLDLQDVRAKAGADRPRYDATSLKGRPLIVAAGRMTADKGFDVLLQAFAQLLATGLKAHLLLLGDGPQRSRLSSLSAEFGISDSVEMPGHCSNPYPDIKAANVFVSASRCEGFSMVLAEAMALGVPIVATDCPSGPREVLDHGRCAVMVPNEDASALAAGIARLLGDSKLSAQLVKAGLQRVEAFSTDRIVPQWSSLLSAA
jgi:glycosyltransferase involved in cell wall biosynthesis